MKKKIKYTNEPMSTKVIRDFLPKPEELVMKEKQVKVTLSLTRRSVEFFKNRARKKQVAYQSMIRSLLDYYTQQNI
jgi:predicted DNA binding CopG/RHH family protein